MQNSHSPSILTTLLLTFIHLVSSIAFPPQDLLNASSISLDLSANFHHPDFQFRTSYAATKIPRTAAFLNAIELMSQYATEDFDSRVRQRHGMVLPNYPQVEIAILPAEGTRDIENCFVIWGLYGGIADMVQKNTFNDSEVTLWWKGQVVGYVYFTIPLDAGPAQNFQKKTSNLISPTLGKLNDTIGSPNMTGTALEANTGRFGWRPLFKPRGDNLPPSDVFLVIMAVIKYIAEQDIKDKVPQAFYIASYLVNANMQFFIKDRFSPRTRPPYFQYAHILESLKRIPAWMLQEGKFAEFYCLIFVNGIEVGQSLMAKGRTPGIGEGHSSS